ncbi:MAG: zinc-ribbon domain-containing protein [Minwuia sp.]|nr:zinc-ribbon domain-containing protein [Minwuia sp.]
MILTCPACATRYVIGDDVFQAGKREVRCARCSHRWTTDGSDAVDEVDARMDLQNEAPKPRAESPEPPTDSEQVGFGLDDMPGMHAAEPEDDPKDEPEDATPDDSLPDPGDEAAPARPVLAAEPKPESMEKASRPKKAEADRGARAGRRRTPAWVWIGWVFLLGCIGGLAAALVLMRGPLVEAWPPLQRLYDTVGALSPGIVEGAHEAAGVELDVESSELVDDHGARQLNLLIRLTNNTESKQSLPIAVVHLLRADGETEKTERIRLPADQPLAPKESRVMALRLSDVPPAVTSVSAESEDGSSH